MAARSASRPSIGAAWRRWTVSYRAPIIISNVGRADHVSAAAADRWRDRPANRCGARPISMRLGDGLSAVTLYLRLKAPVSTLGIHGENYWINTTTEHDDIDKATTAILAGNPRHAYLSFPSAKSGDDRFHTAEIIAMLRPEAFDAWRGTEAGNRGRDYAELKARIAQGLLRLVENSLPGFSALVHLQRIVHAAHRRALHLPPGGTILRPTGNSGPIPINPAWRAHADPRPLSQRLRRREPRHHRGDDGWRGGSLQGSRSGRHFSHHGFAKPGPRHPQRQKPGACARRSSARSFALKTALTPSIWRLEFELDKALRFIPGQFAKLRVAPFEWRDYSIAAATGKRLTLLISNRTHGDGSNYADAVQPGEATEIEAPLGNYHLSATPSQGVRRHRNRPGAVFADVRATGASRRVGRR